MSKKSICLFYILSTFFFLSKAQNNNVAFDNHEKETILTPLTTYGSKYHSKIIKRDLVLLVNISFNRHGNISSLHLLSNDTLTNIAAFELFLFETISLTLNGKTKIKSTKITIPMSFTPLGKWKKEKENINQEVQNLLIQQNSTNSKLKLKNKHFKEPILLEILKCFYSAWN